MRAEASTLARKLAALGPVIHKLTIANDLTATRTGLLVYDAQPFSPQKLSEALSALQVVGLTRAQWPREVLVIAPDTLVGFADAVARAQPIEYYWPPFDQRAGCWSRCAPPQQLAAGMLAYRSAEGAVTLWLRDPLDHDEDFAALTTIAWDWRINVDRIICSSVDGDRWRTMTDRWRNDAARANKREPGKVPESIEPRALSFASLTPFADRWGRAA